MMGSWEFGGVISGGGSLNDFILRLGSVQRERSRKYLVEEFTTGARGKEAKSESVIASIHAGFKDGI